MTDALLGGRRPLEAAAQSESLVRVLADPRAAQHPPGLLILDLDGTLLDNRPRTRRILTDLADTWRERSVEWAEALSGIAVSQVDYLVSVSLASVGITDPEAQREAERFWDQRFFSGDYLSEDTPVPGSVDFVQRAHAAGFHLVYLTGRDSPAMGNGTFAHLRALQFPIAVPRATLVMKPSAHLMDVAFKASVVRELTRLGPPVACFDNDPAHCATFRRLLPQAVTFLVDGPRPPAGPALDERVVFIGDFTCASHGRGLPCSQPGAVATLGAPDRELTVE